MTLQEKINEVAEQIISSRELLTGMRSHFPHGFAAWNVGEEFEGQTKTKPFEGLVRNSHEYGLAWIKVRDLVYPHVKELFDKYGEFGKIPAN